MNMPLVKFSISLVRIETIRKMLKDLDSYCQQADCAELKTKAREVTDNAIAKLYESRGSDLEGTNYLYHDD